MPRQDWMWKRFMKSVCLGAERGWRSWRGLGESQTMTRIWPCAGRSRGCREIPRQQCSCGTLRQGQTCLWVPERFTIQLYPLHQGGWEAISLVPQPGPPTPKSGVRMDTLNCYAVVSFGLNTQSENAKLYMWQPLLLYIKSFHSWSPLLVISELEHPK